MAKKKDTLRIVGLVVAVGGLAGIAWWLVSKNSPPPPAPAPAGPASLPPIIPPVILQQQVQPTTDSSTGENISPQTATPQQIATGDYLTPSLNGVYRNGFSSLPND